jgi:hypothetical protein
MAMECTSHELEVMLLREVIEATAFEGFVKSTANVIGATDVAAEDLNQSIYHGKRIFCAVKKCWLGHKTGRQRQTLTVHHFVSYHIPTRQNGVGMQ